MGLHLYCITSSRAPLPASDTRGIEAATVRSIAAADIAVLVSDHGARPAASLESIRAHNAVVTAAMADDCTPVPVRFGQWLADDAAARAVLDADHARWTALLDMFVGCAEFAIRIFDPAGAPSPEDARPKTGREYMAALAVRVAGPVARQEEAVAPLRDALGAAIRAERLEPLRTAHGVASVAYLVHRAHFDAYHTAVERVRTTMPHLRYLSTGPWPPYSFVTE